MNTILLENPEQAKAFLEKLIFTSSEDDPTKMQYEDLAFEDYVHVLDMEFDHWDEDNDDLTVDDLLKDAQNGNCNLMKAEFPCVVTWWLGRDFDRMGDVEYRLFSIRPLSEIRFDAVLEEHAAAVAEAEEEAKLWMEVRAMQASQEAQNASSTPV